MRLSLIVFLFITSSLIHGALYNVINENEIREINLRNWGGRGFVEPNELHPKMFEPALKGRTGILFSVGTVRSLIAFTMGNFSYLVMLDIDPRVRDFNRKSLDFIKSLAVKFPDNVVAQREAYRDSEFSFAKVFPNEYFWADDTAWKKITHALLDGRIFVVDVDLNDMESAAKLKDSLEPLKEMPRTFDISNVMDYVGDYEGIAATLESLSYNPSEDRVLLTAIGSVINKDITRDCHPKPLGIARFAYYHANLEDFLKWARMNEGVPSAEHNAFKCQEVKLEKRIVPLFGDEKVIVYVAVYPSNAR